MIVDDRSSKLCAVGKLGEAFDSNTMLPNTLEYSEYTLKAQIRDTTCPGGEEGNGSA